MGLLVTAGAGSGMRNADTGRYALAATRERGRDSYQRQYGQR
jgi:hypothetical protein